MSRVWESKKKCCVAKNRNDFWCLAITYIFYMRIPSYVLYREAITNVVTCVPEYTFEQFPCWTLTNTKSYSVISLIINDYCLRSLVDMNKKKNHKIGTRDQSYVFAVCRKTYLIVSCYSRKRETSWICYPVIFLFKSRFTKNWFIRK